MKIGQTSLGVLNFETFEELKALFTTHPKEKVALVVLDGKKTNSTWNNREDYTQTKKIGYQAKVIVQCCLPSSLFNPVVSRVLLKKADSKFKPVKTVQKEVLVVAIDVWHGKGK